jgi:RTX calcium-binding nonapeptide repeat (4 copies)
MAQMRITVSTAIAALASLIGLAVLGPMSASGSVGVDLRVLNTEGKALAQLRQFTDTVQIRTDPDADCFGSGSGGSGRTVTVDGPTALGVVHDAEATQKAIRPVSVTDAFGFGLGICGFGGYKADTGHFWYLKVNHVEASLGGDQVKVSGGDDVLWYLIRTDACPPPDFFCQISDLELQAPARARPNSMVPVHVDAFSRTGERSSAPGAQINGGSAPVVSDGEGNALVPIGAGGVSQLFATRGRDIPSQYASVCVDEDLGSCPAHRGITIAGSEFADQINGTLGPDKLKARGGDDRISVRGGGPDTVKCGAGRDVVKADRTDNVAKNCEKVRRLKHKGKHRK